MNKRERDYLKLLQERCAVLRARVGEGEAGHSSLNYINNWRRELRAMEWAIMKLEMTEHA